MFRFWLNFKDRPNLHFGINASGKSSNDKNQFSLYFWSKLIKKKQKKKQIRSLLIIWKSLLEAFIQKANFQSTDILAT